MRKRLISILLVLCMTLQVFPLQAMAEVLESTGITNESINTKKENPFTDVSKKDWFFDSVKYSLDNGLFSGTEADKFSPYANLTRGMYVTVMGRIAQVDVSKYTEKSTFADVDVQKYYSPYVAWASEIGIVAGIDSEHFAPDTLINREQMAAITARFFKASNIPAPKTTITTKPIDYDKISSYAKEAVMTLWSYGLFKGDENGNFNPQKNASRAEASSFCMRIDTLMIESNIKKPNEKEPPLLEEKPTKAEAEQDNGNSQNTDDSSSSKAQYYTISFETNGGGTISNKVVRKESTLNDLPTPNKQNFIFTGWCYDEGLKNLVSATDKVTKDIKLYAKYTAIGPTHTISFETNGGGTIPDRVVSEKSTLNDLPIPNKQDFIFTGWCYDEGLKNLVSATDIVNKDIKLYAKYTAAGPTNTISFETNGGGTIPNLVVSEKSILNDLPIPYKQDFIFVGWYYDEGLQSLVATTDIVNKDIKLYAKYMMVGPLNEKETPSFASAMDQGKDFTITVKSTEPMSSEDVRAGITAKNLNSTNSKDFIDVSGSENTFKISGKNGFAEGASYKVVLDDERLSFEGFPIETRQYNFTTSKKEVLNLSLNKGLTYIPMGDIRNIVNDGEKVESLSLPLAVATQNEGMVPSDLTTGTFEYNGEIAVRDTVVIYDGIRPDERTLENSDVNTDGDIAYVEITGKSGSTYSYKGADPEEVIFTPDILPVSIDADKDNDKTNNKITVDKSVMVFTDEIYVKIGLDSQTTIDVGDYIAFYSGTMGETTAKNEGYALITGVNYTTEPATSITLDNTTNPNNSTDSTAEGEYIITYKNTTMDDMKSAMDAYKTDSLSGDSIISGVDVEKIERSVEKQAKNSGFAEEAAMYLSDLALKTNTFTELSDDFVLGDFSMKLADGTPISVNEVQSIAAGKKPDVKITDLRAEISKDMKHFDREGLRLVLKIAIRITVDMGDSQIVIDLSGSFEQEVSININVNGEAVWKIWGIFPYIDDYTVTANVDFADFTGISVNATIITREKQNGMWIENSGLKNIADEMKKLIDSKGEGSKTFAEGLSEKYKLMLSNDSEWVQLFEQEIFSLSYSIILVIAIEISVSFVVSADMNISIGFDFWYENAKRYSYTVEVFAKQVYNDVIDIREERYEFTFYALGTIGIRAGIKLEIKVGIFSTKLGSIGFSAEVGAYIRLWGYFYYELKYAASTGRTSRYAGALLIEIGVYLEIKFEAQMFDGELSYNPTLYENEWPLWSAGKRYNVMDFSYTKKETPKFAMKRDCRTATLPNDIFKMVNMDLKTGVLQETIYDRAKDFEIAITNPAFTYDSKTNRVSVDTSRAPKVEGQMIITWKMQPLAFSSEPITRIINLSWDNLRDGYYISLNSNEGSTVPMILGAYETVINAPENPVKTGYVFDGWYTDESLKASYKIPEKMPNIDTVAYARWKPATDTIYTVEHYQQNLRNNLYSAVEGDTEILKGTTDSTVTPTIKSYEGFDSTPSQDIEIKADGSAIARYYYPRNSYTATFDQMQKESIPVVDKVKYEGKITVPVFASDAYTFDGWDGDIPERMPSSNLKFNAEWVADKNVEYRIEHYIQNASVTSEGYTLDNVGYGSGKVGDSITIEGKKIDLGEGISFKEGKVNGDVQTVTNVTDDGKLVIKLFYNRAGNNLKLVLNEEADENGEADIAYKFGTTIRIPNVPVKKGFSFEGWFTDQEMTIPVAFGTLKMPNTEMTIYGKMILDGKSGFVINYNDLEGAENAENPVRYVIGEADITLKAPGSRVGYTFEGWYTDSGHTNKVNGAAITSSSTGAKSFYANWTPIEYAITYYNVEGATNPNTSTYTIEKSVSLSNPTKDGYVFEGWYKDSELTNKVTEVAIAIGSIEGKEFYANWTANKFTVEFKPNGGAGNMSSQEFVYDKAENLIKNEFIREGYTFNGWSKQQNSTNGEYLDETNVKNLATKDSVILYATWKVNKYSIAYVLNGGINENNPTEYTTESNAITLSNPTKKGNTFLGWYKDSIDGNKVETITNGSSGNLNLYAKWEPNTYSISFQIEGAGATGNMDSFKYTYGNYVTLPQNRFICSGYTFDRWEASNGSEYSNGEKIYNLGENITLKPTWIPIRFTIKFLNPEGYTGIKGWKDTMEVTYGMGPALPSPESVARWTAGDQEYIPGASVSTLGKRHNQVIEFTTEWKKGVGTEADPLWIYGMDGIKSISGVMNTQTKYVKLATDITNCTIEPIILIGVDFDGGWCKFENVKVVPSTKNEAKGVGVFGSILNSNIKSLSIVNVDVAGDKSTVGTGMLVGSAGSCTIKDIIVRGGTVHGGDNTGGIVGASSAGLNIINCYIWLTTLTCNQNYKCGWLIGKSSNGHLVTDTENVASEDVLKYNSRIGGPLNRTFMALPLLKPEEIIPNPEPEKPEEIIPNPEPEKPEEIIPNPEPEKPEEIIPNPEPEKPEEIIPNPEPEKPEEIIPNPEPEKPEEIIPNPEPEKPEEIIPNPEPEKPEEIIPNPEPEKPEEIIPELKPNSVGDNGKVKENTEAMKALVRGTKDKYSKKNI